MELQGVGKQRRARVRARLTLSFTLAFLVLAPAVARAAATTALAQPAGAPVLVQTPTTPLVNKPPAGYRLRPLQVQRIAARSPVVIDELKSHPRLLPYEYTRGDGIWQVSWFTPPPDQKEMVQVYVDDATGQVTQAWTGFQVPWTMARGYPGAFGRIVNAWYIWLPMCLAFILPFLPWRRRPTWLLVDLLMLLGFSVSLAFFNRADLGLSVPLMYPFMFYLLVRMILLAFGKGRPRRPLRLLVSPTLLTIGLVFLIGFRIGLNVTDSNVIDVGFAGVIGANKILYGDKLYGGWPSDNPQGDTYGPINYYAYVPFTVVFGWSGLWDNLPAAHAAAIAFDLLTMLGLFLLGRMIRGPTLGLVLAYLWAAYPFTLFVLSSNSNDSLVALFIVITLLVIRWAGPRGVAAGWAGLTKFAPLALGPLFLRGIGPPPGRSEVWRYVRAYVVAIALAMAPVVLSGNLAAFWRDTIAYQVGRSAPFSIWGLYVGYWSGITIIQHLVQGATIAMAIAVMFVPRRRGLLEVAALGAAVIIALQLSLTYWFYLYIPWFFPLVIVALCLAHPAQEEVSESAEPALAHPAAVAV